LLSAVGLGGVVLLALSLRVSAEGPEPSSPPASFEPAIRPAPAPLPPPGALVICGGGRLPDAVLDRFLELAGGSQARIVIVPTADSDVGIDRFAAASLERWRARGPAAVRMLHTRSRAEANDPAFLQPLADATGVWFSGGNQSRLAETYVDTAVEQHLKSLLERGGVVGGTSAGAAIMTRVMITGGRSMATQGRGFDLLPASVVDQHFLKRNRLGRMLSLLAQHPGLAGFGIDEGTALVLRGGRLSVIGDSYVVACMPPSSGQPPQLEIWKPGDDVELPSLAARASWGAGRAEPAPAPQPQVAARSRTRTEDLAESGR
jgi:cyanophycinase